MNILIPMAGSGSRFQQSGYRLSKPCIPVDGTPMIIQAVQSLPPAEKCIFVCRDFHLRDGVDKMIKEQIPASTFLSITDLTDGQASTCLLAKKHINNDTPLMIGACDNGMIWDASKFDALKASSDCLIWTFRNNPCVINHPEQYGWIKTDQNRVLSTSIKKPLSKTPQTDHAVAGAFWFRKGSDFVEAAETMIERNDRINGEFYVDKCIDYLLKKNKTVSVFEIDYYLGWGTPEDLESWEYWSCYFKKSCLI